ncbi:hypothetical protein [Modestobacter sp. VKM Ac-2984]|uniref:hypothetical protein n=1 Tax=Modestobacter sp. VKM Ac-2984 TaxID=3004138 RepID=UPI0022AA3B3F|nr:hypothetical protein [Modestobacter sp. VKM Ac-2984]MCZ2816385.1 hypothetical protein [Modestobacter sp. VKM Ac-2984]
MSRPGALLRLSLSLVVLTLLGGLLVGSAGPAAAASAEPWSATRVVDVGVAGLTWSDLDPERTPELWALAEESAIGALSVRAARPTTCLLDGWATLGAGNRARYPGPVEPVPPVSLPSVPIPDEDVALPGGAGAEEGPAAVQLDTRLSWCGLEEQVADVGLAEPRQTVARVAADEATARFGAEPGALGEAVGCSTVVGRAGSLAVAGESSEFTVRDRLPTDPAEVAALLAECPLTVVSLDQFTDAGAPAAEETDTGTQPSRREAALAVIDQTIGRLRDAVAELPGDTLFLLQGISEVNGGRPQLHVGLANGPGVPPGWLTSASTGRVPFVQLIDVAPTILRALDLDPVASMNGQPFRVAGDRPDLATAIAELEQINTSAVVHYRSTSTTFWALVLLNGALVVLGVLGLGGWATGWLPGRARGRVRGWLQRRTRGRRRTAALRVAALTVAAVPISTYLANLVPWELSSVPRAALAGSVLGCTLVVTAVAALGPWRRTRLGPAIAVLAITLATLVADVLTGSHLELDGLLGYDAIVAGRFTGYGNLSFGLLAVSSLLLTAAAAALVARRVPMPGRRHWLLPVLVAGVGTVVVIGAPSLGRDFGGVLAAVPGFLVLGMLLGRIRVTVVRLVAVLAVAVLAVGAVAVFDWLGPAEERSHLGRFVGQVLDGQAWTVVSRKAQANLNILLGSPLAWMLLVALVAGVWLLRPGGLLRSRPGRPAAGLPAADVRVLRAGLTAVALSLTLGALVNDSGVALPATAATVLVPLLVWLVAGAPGGAEAGRPSPEGASASAPEAPEARVNVGVRGSTGRTS